MFELKQGHKKVVEELESKLKQIQNSFQESQVKMEEISQNHQEEVEKLQFEVKQRSIEVDQIAKSFERFVFP